MRPVRLSVHRLKIIAADGSHTTNQTAYCPSRCAAVGTDVCNTCAHAQTVADDAVICTPPGLEEPAVAEVAGWMALPDVTGVRADVPGIALGALTRKGPWPVPVVDDHDHFIGFVSAQGLNIRAWPWHLVALTPARDLVFGRFLNVAVSERLPVALRLMAHRGARAVALVDGEGVLKGVMSDIDALRGLGSASR